MAVLPAVKSLAVRKSTAKKKRKSIKNFVDRGLQTKARSKRGEILKCIGRNIRHKILDLLSAETQGRATILPPMLPEDVKTKKKTIVLDLDETLVHSSIVPLPCYDFIVEAGTEIFYVLKRPGVDRLLKELGKKFELVLFTAGVREYASAVVDRIDPHRNIIHRLYRDSCSLICGQYVKDLSLLGRDLERTIIVDDTPTAYMLHPRNGLALRPFCDNLSDTDTELSSVLNFFRVAYDYEDMRMAVSRSLRDGFLPKHSLVFFA